MKIFFIIFALLSLYLILKDKKETEMSKKNSNELRERGFFVSKSLNYYNANCLYVDNIDKKIAIAEKDNLTIYDYADIVDFELVQDGGAIISGKGFETAMGGLFLGTAGMLMGSFGERRTSPTCTSLIINIYLNNIKKPKKTLVILKQETRTKTFIYKDAIEKANTILGILKYVKFNQ